MKLYNLVDGILCLCVIAGSRNTGDCLLLTIEREAVLLMLIIDCWYLYRCGSTLNVRSIMGMYVVKGFTVLREYIRLSIRIHRITSVRCKYFISIFDRFNQRYLVTSKGCFLP